jgi:hypothetical protein
MRNIISPSVEAVTSANVSSWSARVFLYAILGFFGPTTWPKIAAVVLISYDTLLTYHTSKHLMRLTPVRL